MFWFISKPFRAVKKDQLVNTINEKDCIVEVEFQIGKKEYKIIRGIKPNLFEIWCNGDMLNQDAAIRDYQKHLEQHILKLNFRSFTQVVILGNASFVPFMQLHARHRREVVEEILDIEIFSKLNLMFREKQKLQDETIKQADFDFQLLDGKIETQQKHIDDISNTNKDTADLKLLEITKSDTDIENYEEDIARVRREITDLQTEILDQTKLKDKHGKLTAMEAKLENTCIKHKKELKFFQTHDDCPICQQSIDEAFKKATIVVKEAKVTELELGMEQIDNAITTSQKKLDKINETVIAIREKELLINRYETSINEIQKYKSKIQTEIDSPVR